MVSERVKYVLQGMESLVRATPIYAIYRDLDIVKKIQINKGEFEISEPTASEISKREIKKTKYSWEPIEKLSRDFQLSLDDEDKNMTLCLRFTSELDGKDDLFYATLRNDMSPFKMTISDRSNHEKISIQEKELILIMCNRACQNAIDMYNKISSSLTNYANLMRKAENHIEQLNGQIAKYEDNTSVAVKNWLTEFSKQYGKNIDITVEAMAEIAKHCGEDISYIKTSLNNAIADKCAIYVNDKNICINKYEIDFEPAVTISEKATTGANTIQQKNSRNVKVLNYLLEIEKAVNELSRNNKEITAVNIAKILGKTSAALTMWFDGNGHIAKKLCDENPELCKNSRVKFKLLHEYIIGEKKRKIKSA